MSDTAGDGTGPVTDDPDNIETPADDTDHTDDEANVSGTKGDVDAPKAQQPWWIVAAVVAGAAVVLAAAALVGGGGTAPRADVGDTVDVIGTIAPTQLGRVESDGACGNRFDELRGFRDGFQSGLDVTSERGSAALAELLADINETCEPDVAREFIAVEVEPWLNFAPAPSTTSTTKPGDTAIVD